MIIDPIAEVSRYIESVLTAYSYRGFTGHEANVPIDNNRPAKANHWPFFTVSYEILSIEKKDQIITKNEYDENEALTVQGENEFSKLFNARFSLDFNSRKESDFIQIINILADKCSTEADFTGFGFESLSLDSVGALKTWDIKQPFEFSLATKFLSTFRMISSVENRPVPAGIELNTHLITG